MNVEIAFAYLKGETVQVKGAPSDKGAFTGEWMDIPGYREPTDIYRVSASIYQFRIKPVVTEQDALLAAGEVMEEHLFEVATQERMDKMNADLKERLGSDEYKFVIATGGVCLSRK
jgi:hypothetical protein